MRLRYFFIILVILQLSVWAFMLTLSFEENSVAFYAVEAATLVNVLFLWYFYRKVMKPIDSITTGLDLLKEQNFNSKLNKRGHYEADKIVDLFNTMLMQLRKERLKSEEQNHFLNLLIECSPMGVVILSNNREIILANKSALKMLGTDDVVGLRMEEIDTPLARDVAKVKIHTSETIRAGNAMIYRCSQHTFIDSGVSHPFYLIESLTDEMMKAEKNAYEKVIRIMAHEVNNTVAGISSAFDTVDVTLSQMIDTEDVREMLKACVERNEKMSTFITNLSNVVKIPEPILAKVDLNDVIERSAVFLQTFCSNHNVRLHIDCCDERLSVNMDVSLFEQVLHNIIKNSVESIECDGDIWINTSIEKHKATLTVADNGKGISKEAEKNLFSPFYTTKPMGQGVGLMFIREILMRHHCTFSLYTAGDGLTCFKITFP